MRHWSVNRSYQPRCGARPLEGQQTDFTFPRRGRPSRKRRLERAGQLSLNLQPCAARVEKISTPSPKLETFDEALQMTFPERELTDEELFAEFNRLFPAEV